MAYTPNNINGQGTMANSAPVVIASNQSTIPVSLAVAPTTPVTGAFFQATQPVSGTVTANTGLAQPLTDTQIRATALPVSGTVSVSNMVSQGLTDTQIRLTPLPVTMSNTLALTDTQLRATAVPISLATAPITPVTGTFFQTTQPVSGTVTANTGLAQPLTDTQLRTTAVPVSMATAPTTPVTGTFFQTTQPVSLATNTPVIAAGTAAIGTLTDSVATGSITTQNLVPAGVATAGSAVSSANLNGYGMAAIQVTGTYTGALSAQVMVDNATWVTLGGTPFLNVNTGALSAAIPSAATSVYQIDVAGFKQIRITALAAVTGTAVVSLQASNGGSLVTLDASLPAGTNTIGAVTVASTTISSGTVTANGGTPFATPTVILTGDTGAKTATGNGNLMGNNNAKGMQIIISMGAVTGTTPTFVAKVQGSVDTGSTFYDIPGATTATIIATGVYGITIFPGVTAVAPVATSGTTAATSQILPRVYRLVWAIGGTTPSFTITNVQVGYIV